MLLGRNESIFHLENKSFTKINFGSLGASRINVILHPMRSSYKYLKLHSRVTSLKKKKKKVCFASWLWCGYVGVSKWTDADAVQKWQRWDTNCRNPSPATVFNRYFFFGGEHSKHWWKIKNIFILHFLQNNKKSKLKKKKKGMMITTLTLFYTFNSTHYHKLILSDVDGPHCSLIMNACFAMVFTAQVFFFFLLLTKFID